MKLTGKMAPSLPDTGDWEALNTTRLALRPKLSRDHAADRYQAAVSSRPLVAPPSSPAGSVQPPWPGTAGSIEDFSFGQHIRIPGVPLARDPPVLLRGGSASYA